MKRTYLARRNALLTSAGLSWGTGALAFAALALLLRLLAPNLFWSALAPAFSVADALATRSHSFFASFSDTAALSARNEALARENAALALENLALERKDADLSRMLGSATTLRAAILVGVVARPPESPYDTLVLAGGSEGGIREGMEAFGAGGVPLGVVSSVSDDFSRVTLFSAPGLETQGWVGPASLPLTLRGEGGGAMSASLARAAPVAVGDTVFVPGPGMLPVGSVARIDRDPSSPGETLYIRPAFNMFSTAWVLLRDTGASFTAALRAATSTLP